MVINSQYQVLKIPFQLYENPIVHIDNMQISASAGENVIKRLVVLIRDELGFFFICFCLVSWKKIDFFCQLVGEVGLQAIAHSEMVAFWFSCSSFGVMGGERVVYFLN